VIYNCLIVLIVLLYADLYGAEVVLGKPAALCLDVRPFPLEQKHEDITARMAVVGAEIPTV